jgi:ribosomal protein S18 acetylase RimI-like enzyme
MSAQDEAALDNPVWSALATRHAALATGNGLALRYRPEYSVLGAVLRPDTECAAALAPLYAPGETITMGGAVVPELGPEWELLHAGGLAQMVCRSPPPPMEANAAIVPLALADAPEMLALVELTRPGPFRERTVLLGDYYGIREQGRLVAMTGERMWIGDFREVSAVCTHPEVRGRGYARALMRRVIDGMLRRGQTPILHAETVNTRAIRLYERLGFVERARFPLFVAKRVA